MTEIKVPSPPNPLDYRNKICLLGSCFAENIGKKLAQTWWPSVSNPLGITYNPWSLFEHIEWALGDKEPDKNRWISHNNLYQHLDLHSDFSHENLDEAKRNFSKYFEVFRNHVLHSDVIIISLGTAMIYEYVHDGKWVNNCHKLPSEEFKLRRLSLSDLINKGHQTLESLHQNNPNQQVIFTVSPIRHIRHGLMDNMASKSTLRLAVEEWVRNESHVHYFPSYEVMLDVLRDYRWYEADLIHPNGQAIDYIFNLFCQVWLDKDALQLMGQVQKIRQSMTHRSFHPESPAHREHVEHTRQKLKALLQNHPELNDSEASSYLSNPDSWHSGKHV